MIARNLVLIGTCLAMGAAAVIGEQVVRREEPGETVSVIYWEKWTGDEAKEMRKVVDAFNRSQSKIVVKYLSISGIDQKTMLATAGGNPPDVAGLWQEQICQFSDAGALMDLSQWAEEAGLSEETYIPAYWKALYYRGGLWGLPSTPASVALHVRTNDVPPEVASPETFPKTIEELDALSKRVSKVKPDGSIQTAGFLPSYPGWFNWAWPVYFGGQVFKDNRITVDTPEALRAMEWYASYAKQFGPQQVQSFQGGFGNFASPQDPFMDGKVLTEMNGVWKANFVRIYKPGLKWFAVPFPYPKDRPDLVGHTSTSQDTLCIPRGAKHAREAFEFIRFVQRQDIMEGLCSGHGKNSPLRKVSPEFVANHPNAFISLFDRLSRSPNAFTAPSVGIFPQIDGEMNVAFQKVSTGELKPKEALESAQKRLDGIWSTYRKQVLGENL